MISKTPPDISLYSSPMAISSAVSALTVTGAPAAWLIRHTSLPSTVRESRASSDAINWKASSSTSGSAGSYRVTVHRVSRANSLRLMGSVSGFPPPQAEKRMHSTAIRQLSRTAFFIVFSSGLAAIRPSGSSSSE